MVSSIVPGAVGAGVLGADLRFARPGGANDPRQERAAAGDRVEISAASLAAVRESVRAGIAQAHHALAVGHDVQATLVNMQGLARAGGAQADLDAMLSALSQRVETAIAQGARLLAGEDLQVQAEPGASPLTLKGADLRLRDEPSERDVLAVGKQTRLDDPDLAQALLRSLETLQAAMGQMLETVQALEAHQGFLSAAEGAVAGVRGDLDAEGARLLSLQVRQGLQSIGAAPIANVEPQAVLALFRA